MKITRIETAHNPGSGLLYCRVYTDAGIVGCGETWYIPSAVEAIIHDWMCQRLIGADPFDIEGHWRFLYERAANFGARGAELRALSTIDLALWDIKGQALGVPIWQLLGGKCQNGVRTYHSIGYGNRAASDTSPRWPGYGKIGEKDPLNDYWNAIHEPAAFAREMLTEGIDAVKLWSLDFAAHKENGNIYISNADIDKGLAPFFAIREAVGNKLDLILDGHGFFQLPVALRIADAIRDVKPLALEDCIRPDCIDTIRDFRELGRIPLAVSEMLIGTEDYRLVLEKRAADYIMIDPTWVGGISQTLKLTDLAQAYNIPVMMHDCTGPLTLMAGIQVGVARGNVAWQETTRRNLRQTYPPMLTTPIEVQNGRCTIPTGPGLGTAWDDKVFATAAHVRNTTL